MVATREENRRGGLQIVYRLQKFGRPRRETVDYLLEVSRREILSDADLQRLRYGLGLRRGGGGHSRQGLPAALIDRDRVGPPSKSLIGSHETAVELLGMLVDRQRALVAVSRFFPIADR